MDTVKNYYPIYYKIFPGSADLVRTFYEIPVTSQNGDNTFVTELNGKRLRFRFRYNRRFDMWSMSIYDAEDSAIIEGRMVVLGADLIGQYTDDRLPDGRIIAVNMDDNDPGHDAGEFDLGDRVRLLFVKEEQPAGATA